MLILSRRVFPIFPTKLADSKSSIEQKYENQFTLEKVNLEKLPDYIKNNIDNYKEWIDT